MDKACRICGNINTEIFYKFNFIENSITNVLNKINLTECSDCKFYFNSAINQSECNRYYLTSTNFTHKLYLDSDLKHDRYYHLLTLLQKFNINFNDEIIDLTASDASLLNYLKHYKYINLTYCDLSDINLNFYDFNKKIKLNLLDKTDFLKINQKFKVIFLVHTLEHIVDLDIVLENIKLLMDDTTLLYIEVPDIDRISFNKYNQHYEINHEHVNLFTKYSLNKLLNKHNYSFIDYNIVDYKYRININVNAFYCVYKYNTNIDNININNVQNTLVKYNNKNILLDYINYINIFCENIYRFIDLDKEYVIYGIGYFAIYFLSLYKNIKIKDFYDDVRFNEYILEKKIKNINELNKTDLILILAPVHFNLIKNKLIKHDIDEINIIKYL